MFPQVGWLIDTSFIVHGLTEIYRANNYDLQLLSYITQAGIAL